MFGNRLYNINMGEGANMEEFLLGMKNLQIQSGGIDDIMKDEDVLTVLNALPLVSKVLCRALRRRMNYHPLKNFPKTTVRKSLKDTLKGEPLGGRSPDVEISMAINEQQRNNKDFQETWQLPQLWRTWTLGLEL
jgi:hypothetical protein